jgi:D-aminoacyl-tRNA deacylase
MHRIALIASEKDPAGRTIYAQLLKQGFEAAPSTFHNNPVHTSRAGEAELSLYLIADELLAADNLEQQVDADLFVFLSKHRSGSNTKSFAVHSIGNWSGAKAGGKYRELVPGSAALQRLIFLELQNAREGYETTMEATHHGPYMEKPSLFVEVGSTEEEWQDIENAKIISNAVLNAIEKFSLGNYEKPVVAIGIGGPHYCNNFNKLVERKNYAFAHVCPKHSLNELDPEMLKQAMEKTMEDVDAVVLDWKGLGGEKQKMLDIAHKSNVKVERTDQLLKG